MISNLGLTKGHGLGSDRLFTVAYVVPVLSAYVRK